MSSRSFSVGNYIRHVEEPENEFDTRVRAFRDGSVDELLPQKFENWSAEQVKEAVGESNVPTKQPRTVLQHSRTVTPLSPVTRLTLTVKLMPN